MTDLARGAGCGGGVPAGVVLDGGAPPEVMGDTDPVTVAQPSLNPPKSVVQYQP